MLGGFLGNDVERRLQGTQNFSSLGFIWAVEYMKQGKYISEDERRGCKLTFLFPTWG
jgi:hypothetical protein